MRLIRAGVFVFLACLPWAAAGQSPPVEAQGQMSLLPAPGSDRAAETATIPDDLPEAIADALPPGLDPGDAGADPISPFAPAASLRPAQRDTWAMPTLRWDDHARSARWTAAVMSALRGPGAPLLDVVPRDIDAWCPGYPQAEPAQRAAFWAGLVSVLAWQESTHRPHAVGGGGRWFGMVQISPPTARYRNCAARTGTALLDGAANLRCGIRIMAITVPRDGVVAQGNRGVAADWGPLHSSQSRKREEMRTWVRSQDYCARPPSPVRPIPRPLLVSLSPGAFFPEGIRPQPRPDPTAP